MSAVPDAASFLHEPGPRGYSLGLHAFCKVNLALAVGRRRRDGFHAVDTVLQTVSLADTLWARPRPRGVRLQVVRRGPARRAGLAVGGGRDNLVLRAARLLRHAHGHRGGAELVLVKRVPAGSGLGGGSSDAAAALRLLARLWDLPTPLPSLEKLARALGSDCPFFLAGGRARATGRGEKLRRLPVGRPRRLLLALPRRGVRTVQAYRLLDRDRERARGGRRGPLFADTEIVSSKLKDLTGSERVHNIGTLRHILPAGEVSGGTEGPSRNDFERAVLRRYPEIRAAKGLLVRLGMESPTLSGSGSAVFGLVPARGARGRITRWRPGVPELVYAEFTRVGSLWCL